MDGTKFVSDTDGDEEIRKHRQHCARVGLQSWHGKPGPDEYPPFAEVTSGAISLEDVEDGMFTRYAVNLPCLPTPIEVEIGRFTG